MSFRRPASDLGLKRTVHTSWNGKQIHFRSSYEFEYAKKLDKKRIDYEVETLRIIYWDTQQQKHRYAVPDFYLPSLNMIVEVKGQFFYNRQEMIDKFKVYKKLGYNCKMILDGWEVKLPA